MTETAIQAVDCDLLSTELAEFNYHLKPEDLEGLPDDRRGELFDYVAGLKSGKKDVTEPAWFDEFCQSIDAPAEAVQTADLQSQIDELRKLLDQQKLSPRELEARELTWELSELSTQVNDAQDIFIGLDKRTKSAKKAYEALLDELQAKSTRISEVLNGGDYQPRLFDPAAKVDIVSEPLPEPIPEDSGKLIGLCDFTTDGLANWVPDAGLEGLTEKKCEALVSIVGGENIEHLEAWLRSGNNFETLPGFSEKWYERTRAAYEAIRQQFPMPVEPVEEAS